MLSPLQQFVELSGTRETNSVQLSENTTDSQHAEFFMSYNISCFYGMLMSRGGSAATLGRSGSLWSRLVVTRLAFKAASTSEKLRYNKFLNVITITFQTLCSLSRYLSFLLTAQQQHTTTIVCALVCSASIAKRYTHTYQTLLRYWSLCPTAVNDFSSHWQSWRSGTPILALPVLIAFSPSPMFSWSMHTSLRTNGRKRKELINNLTQIRKY